MSDANLSGSTFRIRSRLAVNPEMVKSAKISKNSALILEICVLNL